MQKEEAEKIITKCKETIESYIDARKMLASARSFGTIDLMGGGILSSIFKHDRLNKFIEKMEKANTCLKELLRMLPEEYLSKPEIHISKCVSALDIYLDNFIADSIVHYKMEECHIQICDIVTQLDDILLKYKNYYNENFPEGDNEFGHIEMPDIICPRCRKIHSMELLQCPGCGLAYSDEIQPILKI